MIVYKCFTGCPTTGPCVLDYFASPCICSVAGTTTGVEQAGRNGGSRLTKKPEHAEK